MVWRFSLTSCRSDARSGLAAITLSTWASASFASLSIRVFRLQGVLLLGIVVVLSLSRRAVENPKLHIRLQGYSGRRPNVIYRQVRAAIPEHQRNRHNVYGILRMRSAIQGQALITR